MRIVVHDYAGHPFQVDLSRELARRGHDVLHLYCGSVVGPHGDMGRRADDPSSLQIEAVSAGATFDKYSARRVLDELRYGRILTARVREFDPRVVLSANAPLLSQRLLLAEARRARRRFLYWWQDSYGVGVRAVLTRRSKSLGRLVGGLAIRLERSMLDDSDRVITIASSMASIATSWGVDPAIIEVIPNWAPLDGLPDPVPRSPGDRPLIVYAGTLGLKHDPGLLLDLARALGDDATMLVVSEGPGRRILEQAKSDDDLHGLVLRDYMPVADLDGTLARASVQLVILQGDAGAFSVPSKVLTYLAAGKPVVGSLPPTNAAADVIRASGGGTVVAPDDSEGLIKAVKHYVSDPEAAAEAGRSARRYAEDHFAVGPIADTFEALMTKPRRAGRADRRPVRVAYDSVRRVWEHPSNRGHRSRALARYVGWQVWQRSARRPITVQLAPGRRIRCHPHSPVTSAIIYYGLPDHADMRFVRDYLVAGDVFVDVGAHEGTYSLLATATAGVMAVAVEPSSRSYERLEANIRLNGASDQIHPVRRALGRRAGQVLMRVGSDSMNDVRTVPTEGVETEEVVASTLDEVIDACDVRSVSMIKIDVEGAELDVLAGASSTIAAHRPVLLVEVNDPDRLAAFAVTAGYHPVAYDPERRALVATRVKDRDGSNVLLVPDLGIMASRLAT